MCRPGSIAVRAGAAVDRAGQPAGRRLVQRRSGPCARSPCCRSATGSGWGSPRSARSPAAVAPAASRTARATGAGRRDRRSSSPRRPGSRASAAACGTRRRDTAPRCSGRRCRRRAGPRPGCGPSAGRRAHRPGQSAERARNSGTARAAGQQRGRAQAQAEHLAASRVHGDLLLGRSHGSVDHASWNSGQLARR